MKKNTMATAIIAGLAGVAGIANISTAVNLNPDGVGQVLLYPYYTVNGGNTTVLSVVNTTDSGKAVKVRFLDARNSREVLDFNLYLSEYDVWTGGIFSLTDTGPANIVTDDTSCTVPGIEDGIFQLPTLADGRRYFPFRTTAFTDYSTAGLNQQSPTRTRDGYVEMIEMGSIPYDSDFGFGFFLTHINNRPADCSYLEAAWLASGTPGGSGIWFNNAFIDMEAPTGGLFGGAAIVNVASGTYINYNAEAIDGFSAGVIHTPPGSIFPNLSSANGAVAGAVTSYVFDRGRLITSNWLTANNGGANAVSAVLMREAVFNEYEVDPNLGAASEWIVTFPTRKLYVGSTTSTAPWTTSIGFSSPLSGVCERVSGRIYNREEDTFRIFDFSPGLGQTQICWEANPLWFTRTAPAANAATPIHGAPGLNGSVPALWTGVPTYLTLFGITQKTFNNGWFWLGFYDENAINPQGLLNPLLRLPLVETANAAGTQPDRYFGLPAIGYWALRVLNVNQGAGLQASYGGAYPHRASRACFKGTFGNSAPCD
jgi:hypothetical protein